MATIRLHRCREETIIKIGKSVFADKDNVEFMYLGDDDNQPGTLRDISIIMDEMVGQGVTWQLAVEIADRFNLSSHVVDSFLHELFVNYAVLSEEEALDKEDKAWSKK